jgi:hypothetical protein
MKAARHHRRATAIAALPPSPRYRHRRATVIATAIATMGKALP